MAFNATLIIQKLSEPVNFHGLILWEALIICVVLVITFLILFTCCIYQCRQRRRKSETKQNFKSSQNTMSRKLSSLHDWDRNRNRDRDRDLEYSIGTPEKQIMYGDHTSSRASNMEPAVKYPPLREIRIGNSYTLKEIGEATNGYSSDYLLGAGDFGVVYRGVLFDRYTPIAVKNLSNKRSTYDEFTDILEALSTLKHKNLVKLLGYCAEEDYRMIVYEYIDNGNLEQWLHQSTNEISPLTWNIRMNILLGVAKGLNYLHECSEHAINHQRLKSSNILLDKQWCPKLSDYCLANLVGYERYRSKASPTGMFGYTDPDSNSHVMDEKSDVYSYGVLIMEIISGKTAMEYSKTEIGEYLVEWTKAIVDNQNYDLVLDPKLHTAPSTDDLKRILLLAMRCVDPDIVNRPKMGLAIQVLNPYKLLT